MQCMFLTFDSQFQFEVLTLLSPKDGFFLEVYMVHTSLTVLV